MCSSQNPNVRFPHVFLPKPKFSFSTCLPPKTQITQLCFRHQGPSGFAVLCFRTIPNRANKKNRPPLQKQTHSQTTPSPNLKILSSSMLSPTLSAKSKTSFPPTCGIVHVALLPHACLLSCLHDHVSTPNSPEGWTRYCNRARYAAHAA